MTWATFADEIIRERIAPARWRGRLNDTSNPIHGDPDRFYTAVFLPGEVKEQHDVVERTAREFYAAGITDRESLATAVATIVLYPSELSVVPPELRAKYGAPKRLRHRVVHDGDAMHVPGTGWVGGEHELTPEAQAALDALDERDAAWDADHA